MQTIRITTILLAAFLQGQSALADTTYIMNTDTGNTDGAVLISGFLVTDGTIGTDLRLGDVLIDWEITISEGSSLVTMTTDNSFIGFNTIENFTITNDGIFVETLASTASDFRIRENPSATNGFYAMSNSPNFFSVLVNATGESATGVPLSVPYTVAVAIPEPCLQTLLLPIALTSSAMRRRRNPVAI